MLQNFSLTPDTQTGRALYQTHQVTGLGPWDPILRTSFAPGRLRPLQTTRNHHRPSPRSHPSLMTFAGRMAASTARATVTEGAAPGLTLPPGVPIHCSVC